MYNDFNSGCFCKNENGIALYHSYGSIAALLNNKKITHLKIFQAISISENQDLVFKPFGCPLVTINIFKERFEIRTLVKWLYSKEI